MQERSLDLLGARRVPSPRLCPFASVISLPPAVSLLTHSLPYWLLQHGMGFQRFKAPFQTLD